MEQLTESVETEPGPRNVLPYIEVAILTEHLMDKEILSPEQQDQIVTAVVLLLWLKDTQKALTLASTYKENPKQAYEDSNDVFLELKSKAFAAPEYGITDKVFLFLDIPGATKDECKAIWEPYFEFAFDVLGIPITEQFRAFFSGLGFRKFFLCIIAYHIYRNKAFCVHEYNHLRFAGFIGHPFFDEVMTELLAYEECGYFDRATHTVASREYLDEKKIDMDYYDHVELFLEVAKKHPGLFELVEDLYKSGDMNRITEIQTLVGKDVFDVLEKTNPDEYDPKLGKSQPFLSPEEAKIKLKEIL